MGPVGIPSVRVAASVGSHHLTPMPKFMGHSPARRSLHFSKSRRIGAQICAKITIPCSHEHTLKQFTAETRQNIYVEWVVLAMQNGNTRSQGL